MQQKLPENRASTALDADYEKLGRDALIALLRSAIQQRDEVISKYEAMAYQVDESTREIDDAMLTARDKAEQAKTSERHAEAEERYAERLARQLEEERRKSAALAADFAIFREAVAKAPVADPWGQLWRAISQIGEDAVVWARAKIPPDSKYLPWFDKTVDGAKKGGRLACKWGLAAYDWAKPQAIELYRWARPRAIELWKRGRSEIERRMAKGEK